MGSLTTPDAPTFGVVRYNFKSDPWYCVARYPDGSTLHGEPLATEWAAGHMAELWQARYYRDMAKQGDLGNGDTCPLFPEHGAMYVLPHAKGEPPKQYCPHVVHDGVPKGGLREPTPRSRAFWPLFGFDESVATYMARLDKAIREADLPDLSDLEVQ